MSSCGEGRFQTGVSGYQTPISTRLRILSLNRSTLHSVPPRQPPYPACELQEWKTGALGGHHWGNWGSQGKGQDPGALVTETRSVPVRLLLSTPDTTKPLPFGTQVQNSSFCSGCWPAYSPDRFGCVGYARKKETEAGRLTISRIPRARLTPSSSIYETVRMRERW